MLVCVQLLGIGLDLNLAWQLFVHILFSHVEVLFSGASKFGSLLYVSRIFAKWNGLCTAYLPATVATLLSRGCCWPLCHGVACDGLFRDSLACSCHYEPRFMHLSFSNIPEHYLAGVAGCPHALLLQCMPAPHVGPNGDTFFIDVMAILPACWTVLFWAPRWAS